ncbi:MAG: AraC family transcriptional regulator [Clostridia bacterium]|nr:AraC family transcriptional regulator [Clostridia bacterium]
MLENKTLYHFDKHFVNNPLPFGDISLLQIGRRYCKPTEIITAHPHLNWFELTIVTSGKGVVITNGVETQVQSGDIYLSFPCDVHEIRANEKDKLEYDFFSFSCNDRNLKQDLKNITRNYWGSENRIFQDEKISDLIQFAIAEFLAENQSYSEQLLTNVFHLILIYLIRNFNDIKRKAAHISQSGILCFQLMNYIDTHIYSLQKLDELAPKFNYNYGYLSGLFKRTTGKTISEYYNHRKMETAKALILEKKKKIGEIAEMLGYNLYSFSKAFKAKYGVSPKIFSKRN